MVAAGASYQRRSGRDKRDAGVAGVLLRGFSSCGSRSLGRASRCTMSAGVSGSEACPSWPGRALWRSHKSIHPGRGSFPRGWQGQAPTRRAVSPASAAAVGRAIPAAWRRRNRRFNTEITDKKARARAPGSLPPAAKPQRPQPPAPDTRARPSCFSVLSSSSVISVLKINDLAARPPHRSRERGRVTLRSPRRDGGTGRSASARGQEPAAGQGLIQRPPPAGCAPRRAVPPNTPARREVPPARAAAVGRAIPAAWRRRNRRFNTEITEKD